MNKSKVFVDGQEGTTGLEINARLQKRADVEILCADTEKKKDLSERSKYINEADVVFLCLPDDAARESVSLVKNPHTRVIDGSTAHRTLDGWAYGIPELSEDHRKKIEGAKRVSVPGCHATGFVMLMYPLVKEGVIPADYPVSCHSVTGYSGGGKKLIERYESAGDKTKFDSPRFYALDLRHKHLPEMQKQSGFDNPPVFTPILGNFYRGMTVAVPLCASRLSKKATAEDIRDFYAEYYAGEKFVRVLPFGVQNEFEFGYLDAEACNFTNNVELMAFGGGEQILVAARLDNLGKGASGAAIQNMNVMLEIDETYSLV